MGEIFTEHNHWKYQEAKGTRKWNWRKAHVQIKTELHMEMYIKNTL